MCLSGADPSSRFPGEMDRCCHGSPRLPRVRQPGDLAWQSAVSLSTVQEIQVCWVTGKEGGRTEKKGSGTRSGGERNKSEIGRRNSGRRGGLGERK